MYTNANKKAETKSRTLTSPTVQHKNKGQQRISIQDNRPASNVLQRMSVTNVDINHCFNIRLPNGTFVFAKLITCEENQCVFKECKTGDEHTINNENDIIEKMGQARIRNYQKRHKNDEPFKLGTMDRGMGISYFNINSIKVKKNGKFIYNRLEPKVSTNLDNFPGAKVKGGRYLPYIKAMKGHWGEFSKAVDEEIKMSDGCSVDVKRAATMIYAITQYAEEYRYRSAAKIARGVFRKMAALEQKLEQDAEQERLIKKETNSSNKEELKNTYGRSQTKRLNELVDSFFKWFPMAALKGSHAYDGYLENTKILDEEEKHIIEEMSDSSDDEVERLSQPRIKKKLSESEVELVKNKGSEIEKMTEEEMNKPRITRSVFTLLGNKTKRYSKDE